MSTSSDPPSTDLPKWVRPVIEFGPLFTFFIVQRTTKHLDDMGGLYWATIALMVTTSIAVIASRVFEKRWPKVPLITGVFVGVMGGLTIYLKSELFIKIKPTFVYGTFAALLLGGLATGHLLLKGVMGAALKMTDVGWRKFTMRIGGFCLALALANELFRQVLSTDHWTTVKTFGYGIAFFAFLLMQGGLIEAHALTEEASNGVDSEKDSPTTPPSQ